MGKIYSECVQVRIWLGCDSSQCRLMPSRGSNGNGANDDLEGTDPFEIIPLLANDRHVYEWPCFQPQTPDTAVYKPDEDFSVMCEGFLAVYRSPWWTRMWTVQEAILPRTGLLYFDTWKTSLQTFTDCGTYYSNHAWKACCNDAALQLPRTMGTALRDFCVVTQGLLYDRKRNENDELHRHDLQTQHVAYGFRACQDPRDKVYGLLGIVNDQFLTPDYSLSKEEVFYQATCRMLCCKQGSLSCLTGPQYGPALDKLASWVREFDAPYNRSDVDIVLLGYRLVDHGVFRACADHKSNPVLLKAPPGSSGETVGQVGLKVMGRRVGKLTFVSEDVQTQISISDNGARRGRYVFRQWTLSALSLSAGDSPAHVSGTRDLHKKPDIIMAFWRTLLGGFDIAPGSEYIAWNVMFTPATMRWLEHFLAWVEDKDVELNATLSHIISIITHGRCYFRAENNGQGLCYPTARVGDEVWVLDGGNVPFILRPAHLNKEEREALKPVDAGDFGGDESDGSSGSHQSDKPIEGYYHFIGDCYFDGYMHGEAVRDSTIREQSIALV